MQQMNLKAPLGTRIKLFVLEARSRVPIICESDVFQPRQAADPPLSASLTTPLVASQHDERLETIQTPSRR